MTQDIPVKTRKIGFDYRKGRLTEDPRNLHVCMDYQGKHWLGTVKSFEAESGYLRLTVHHFNGEPWPFKPTVDSVDVI